MRENISGFADKIHTQRQAREEWKAQTPEQLSAGIMEEAGELLEAIQNGMPAIEVASEIGDVLWLTLGLCAELGIVPEDAVEMKIVRNAIKYPDAFLSNGWETDQAMQLSKDQYDHSGGDESFYNWYSETFPIDKGQVVVYQSQDSPHKQS